MKYKFSFIMTEKTMVYPKGELWFILGSRYSEKVYNVKRNLIKKKCHYSNWDGQKSRWYENEWIISFSIDVTPKEAYELGETLNRAYHYTTRYHKKGCNEH